MTLTNPLPINEGKLTGRPLRYSTSLSIAFSTALVKTLVNILPQELMHE